MVKKAAKKSASRGKSIPAKGRAPIKPSAAKKAAASQRSKKAMPARRVRPDKLSAAAEQAANNEKALKVRDAQQAKRDLGDDGMVDAHNEEESDTANENLADSDIDEEDAVDDVLGDSDDDMDDDGSDID